MIEVAFQKKASREHLFTQVIPATFPEEKLAYPEGHTFRVSDAGRSLNDPTLHLKPLPLIEEDKAVKVALQSGSAASTPEPALA